MADIKSIYDADVLKGVTLVVTVKPTVRYRVRVQIALLLVRLASRIAGYEKTDVRDDGEAQQ